MICPIGNHPTSRLIIRQGRKICAQHLGMSETGGVKIDGALTRTSDRVRQQQQTNEGDLILPHVFNAQLNKWEPNPDFVERYAEQLPTYFTQDEMESAGYSKIDKLYQHHDQKLAEIEAEQSDVEFVADDSKIVDTVEQI